MDVLISSEDIRSSMLPRFRTGALAILHLIAQRGSSLFGLNSGPSSLSGFQQSIFCKECLGPGVSHGLTKGGDCMEMAHAECDKQAGCREWLESQRVIVDKGYPHHLNLNSLSNSLESPTDLIFLDLDRHPPPPQTTSHTPLTRQRLPPFLLHSNNQTGIAGCLTEV